MCFQVQTVFNLCLRLWWMEERAPGSDKHVVACNKARTGARYGRLAKRAGVTSDTAPGLTRLPPNFFVPVARSDALLSESGFLLNGAHPKVQRHNRQAAPQINMSSPTPTTTTTTNGSSRRPSAASRFPTAPAVVTMNGHFASVGEAPSKEQYEHGIQVIDEEKEFKYATGCTEG